MAVMLTNAEGWPGLKSGVRLIGEGAAALDVVEQMIRDTEAEPEVHSVGLGSWPNAAGELELDASIMDGNSRAAGSVGALKGFLHPITVARAVMNELPHVFLAGDGAARFAGEIGAARADLMTDVSAEQYELWVRQVVPAEERERWPDAPMREYATRALDPVERFGTTVVLVLTDDGSLAAGVSTSGWAWKYPGRLGDSPVIGAGCYADSRYGAAACTGLGELTIRSCTAFAVVHSLRLGLSVKEACLASAAELAGLDHPAGSVVTIHALAKNGDSCVLRVGGDSSAKYFLWERGMRGFGKRSAVRYRN